MKTYKQLQESINMAKAKMGDVIKDFQDSDAPQFKGKSDEKRREMAIAAKMSAEEVEEQIEESDGLKPFIVVHAKHGKFETHAGSTYEAAKNAAAHWKTKKGTAGMDVHRADITHSTQHVG